VRRDVGELPAHPLLVGGEALDRCPREAQERDVALVQVDQLAVEPVREARAARACPGLVIRPEHDVVGEELGAAIKELGEGLLPLVGVELVLLPDHDPGELEPLPLDLLVSLSLFRLELCQLVACRLPLVARSDLVPSHFVLPPCEHGRSDRFAVSAASYPDTSYDIRSPANSSRPPEHDLDGRFHRAAQAPGAPRDPA
jgi:hypothetical protein